MSYQKLYWGLVPFYILPSWRVVQTLESQLKAMKTEGKGFYMYTELQQPLIVTVLHKQQWRIKGRGDFTPKIVKLRLNHTPSGKEKEQLVCLSNIIFFLETRGILLHKSDFNCSCVV